MLEKYQSDNSLKSSLNYDLQEHYDLMWIPHYKLTEKKDYQTSTTFKFNVVCATIVKNVPHYDNDGELQS